MCGLVTTEGNLDFVSGRRLCWDPQHPVTGLAGYSGAAEKRQVTMRACVDLCSVRGGCISHADVRWRARLLGRSAGAATARGGRTGRYP